MQEIPAQHQNVQPGRESQMTPAPYSFMENYKAAGKLEDKVALITGGDSGIGRATAIAFAKEGADVAIIYLEEDGDAEETKDAVEHEGRKCLIIRGDITDAKFCEDTVEHVIDKLGKINILVNNAGEQHPQKDLTEISDEQLHRTFATNIFGAFYLTRAALPHMHKGDSIINTASNVAYKGNEELIDYGATKGAMLGFTRSLAQNLAKKGIRVNGVAPGPIWTSLIPSSFSEKEVKEFGQDTPLGRPGQPDEVAPCFVFLASDDASYMTGQFLHPNGGWAGMS
jgi:NAD(P)-dependent dehydrogenase (short-subunit alcohol dehydrogenase family)